MCGIAGIIGPRAAEYRSAVKTMIAAMAHRGPDGEGLYISPSGYCVLGHRRLSVLDLTENAAQPMMDDIHKNILCYNGECYNYPELKKELVTKGATFASSGDTEVILRLLSREGTECLSKLNAMFSLAFWRERDQTLILARDRFGQKPLYYILLNGLIIFASEVRAILAAGLVPHHINVNSVLNFLTYGSVPGPSTIVEGVRLLPAAHYIALKVRSDKISFSNSPCRYWSPSKSKTDTSPEEISATFSASVKRHMISDVPIGVFLSGGIDSSAVAAGAIRSHCENVNTLCVVYPEYPKECEGLHAKRVANAIGSNHIEVPVTGKTMLELVHNAVDAMDQPTVDGINTYIVSYAAHQAGFKVALSGLGGDELFGGYLGVFRDPLRLLYLRRSLGVNICRFMASCMGILGDNRKMAKIADALIAPDGLLPAYLSRRRIFTSHQIHKLFPTLKLRSWLYGIPIEQFDSLNSMISGRDDPDALGLLDMEQYMGQQLLRDSDSMAMAHSLEIRLPFLDNEFSSLALQLPSDTRIPNGIQKHRFVEAVCDWIPTENISRPKQGFGMPFEAWMLGDLHNTVFTGIGELIQAIPFICGSSTNKIASRFFKHPDKIGWSRPWSMFVLGKYLKKMKLTCP